MVVVNCLRACALCGSQMLPVEHLSAKVYNDILHGMLGVKNCRFTRVLHDNANGGYDEDKSIYNDPLIEVLHRKYL